MGKEKKDAPSKHMEQYEECLRQHCFKPGQSGNPKGRPKGTGNRIPNLLKECIGQKKAALVEELNSIEVDAIENLVLTLGIKELNEVAKNDNTPAYLTTLARAAIMDMKNGKTRVMDLLRDRQFGAVKKEVDVTSNGVGISTTTMTPDEAKEMLKRIEESC